MSCLFLNWISLLEGAIQAVSGPLNGLEVKSHYEVVLTLLAFASFSFSFVAMFIFTMATYAFRYIYPRAYSLDTCL